MQAPVQRLDGLHQPGVANQRPAQRALQLLRRRGQRVEVLDGEASLERVAAEVAGLVGRLGRR